MIACEILLYLHLSIDLRTVLAGGAYKITPSPVRLSDNLCVATRAWLIFTLKYSEEILVLAFASVPISKIRKGGAAVQNGITVDGENRLEQAMGLILIQLVGRKIWRDASRKECFTRVDISEASDASLVHKHIFNAAACSLKRVNHSCLVSFLKDFQNIWTKTRLLIFQ